jgi:hypothetical protein
MHVLYACVSCTCANLVRMHASLNLVQRQCCMVQLLAATQVGIHATHAIMGRVHAWAWPARPTASGQSHLRRAGCASGMPPKIRGSDREEAAREGRRHSGGVRI